MGADVGMLLMGEQHSLVRAPPAPPAGSLSVSRAAATDQDSPTRLGRLSVEELCGVLREWFQVGDEAERRAGARWKARLSALG